VFGLRYSSLAALSAGFQLSLGQELHGLSKGFATRKGPNS
jgi:hypothetical protein